MKDSTRDTSPATGVPVVQAQRAILEELLELTDQQAQALNAGDLEQLTGLSEVRSTLVRQAAVSLPPQQPWHPDLAELVELQRRRSSDLQQGIRACMAAVRRELSELTRHEQIVSYLASDIVQRRTSWEG